MTPAEVLTAVAAAIGGGWLAVAALAVLAWWLSRGDPDDRL